MSATFVALASTLVVAQVAVLQPAEPAESGRVANERSGKGEVPRALATSCAVDGGAADASSTTVSLARAGLLWRVSLTDRDPPRLDHDAASPQPFRTWLRGIGRTSALYGSVLVGGTVAGLGAFASHLALRPGQTGLALLIGFGVQQVASAVTLRLIGRLQGHDPGWAAALFCQWLGMVVGAIPLAVVAMFTAFAGPPPPGVAVPTLMVAGVLSSWISVAAYGAAGDEAPAPVQILAVRF